MQEEIVAQIVVTLTKQGVQVSGQIDNKLLAYGLLEQAKDNIRQHHDNLAKNGLTIVHQPLNGHEL